MEIFQTLGPALKKLWLPRLQLTLAEAAKEGAEKSGRANASASSPTTGG
jgi:hypothetical protein